MATMSREPSQRPLADDGSSNLLLEVGRTIRDDFHLLAGLSLAYLLVAMPFVVLATITSWAIAWAPLVLATAPVWAAIVASADRLLRDEAATWRTMLHDGRHNSVPAIRIGIAPALCGSVVLGLAQGSDGAAWREVLLVAATGGAIALLVLLIPAFPLVTRSRLTGLSLWQASAWVVVNRPMQVLGCVTIAAAGIGLTLAFGPAILLGVAPLGVLVTAITLPDPE